MTRRKFRFFMLSFVMVSLFILAGFMVQNVKYKRSSSSLNPSPDTVLNETMSDGGLNSALKVENLEFFVNESAVKKTKTTTNEVTTFVIEAKLFITNNGSKKKTVIHIVEAFYEYINN